MWYPQIIQVIESISALKPMNGFAMSGGSSNLKNLLHIIRIRHPKQDGIMDVYFLIHMTIS